MDDKHMLKLINKQNFQKEAGHEVDHHYDTSIFVRHLWQVCLVAVRTEQKQQKLLKAFIWQIQQDLATFNTHAVQCQCCIQQHGPKPLGLLLCTYCPGTLTKKGSTVNYNYNGFLLYFQFFGYMPMCPLSCGVL